MCLRKELSEPGFEAEKENEVKYYNRFPGSRELAEQYEEDYRIMEQSGMSAESIEAIKQADREDFNRMRQEYVHSVPIQNVSTSVIEKAAAVSDEYRPCRNMYWWMDDIDSERFSVLLEAMDPVDLAIIDLHAYLGVSLKRTAAIMYMSYSGVCARWRKIKGKFAEVFPEYFG